MSTYLRYNNNIAYIRYNNAGHVRYEQTEFLPSSVGTPRLWLDANDDTSLTKVDVGAGVYAVSSWLNKINYTSELSLDQSTTILQPAFEIAGQNGKNVLRFGSSKYLDGSSLSAFKFLHGSAGGTVFLALKMLATDNNNTFINSCIGTVNTEANGPGLYVWYDDRFGSSRNNQLRTTLGGPESMGTAESYGYIYTNNFISSSTVFFILGITIDPSSGNRIKTYLNGTLIDSSAPNNNSTELNQETVLRIGRADTIGEVLIYEGPLSSENFSSVNSYLTNKWGAL